MADKKPKSMYLGTHWILIIAVLTILAFFVNYISFRFDISYSVANLFLIPVIVATFLYQKKGLLYTFIVMVLYLLFAYFMAPESVQFLNAGEHVIVMSGIALIITLLSVALHDSEKRYRLLFETSPAPFIVTDSFGIITDVNENFHELFGYKKDSLAGLNVNELDFIAKESRVKIKESVDDGFDRENVLNPRLIQLEDEKGFIHTCRLFTSNLYDEGGTIEMKMIALLDITDNVIAEKRIKLSLKEKEMLLKEVHHRVKNNLQIIVSILKLQLNRTHDPETRETLKDCQNRVYSMSLVHEKMYRSESFATINIKEYLESLSKDVLMGYSDILGRVKVEVTSEKDLSFDLDTIVPCALITSELLTNSLKYAFPNGRLGHISIDISGKTPPYRFVYKDDGIGMPADFDSENTNTLGVKIVRSLVKQLRGDLKINSNAGIEIIITFPIDK
ncbi:MAG: histidine kinase dimerization/phosphoacceptor domain -containing protein [Methanomicrobium sp.]|nr:histidine kinase dimerization/phosphoacceptor domain -containing protein [Methanomicrobium sp.]